MDEKQKKRMGRPSVGSIRLPAITVSAEAATHLREVARKLDLSLPQIRRAAYHNYTLGNIAAKIKGDKNDHEHV